MMETLINMAWDLARLGFYLSLAAIALSVPVGIAVGLLSGITWRVSVDRFLKRAAQRAGEAAEGHPNVFRHHDAMKPTCPSGGPLSGSTGREGQA